VQTRGVISVRPKTTARDKQRPPRIRSKSLALGACLLALAAPARSHAESCAEAPASPLVVNVRDKGATGDSRTDDTAAIQAAIDEIAGSGGTVLVPAGTYLVDAATANQLKLKSDMTFKLAKGAILKAIPNSAEGYAVLTISGVSNVRVVGGTLQGDRPEHQGKKGQWGMGIRVDGGASQVTVSGVTAVHMWGDGFYVEKASDVKFCSVTADNNRRQGLSIIDANGVLVTGSVFKNTHGTRPSAGIDLEPDTPTQEITNIRIERSKFLNNAGGSIQIAGKKGRVSNVKITKNVFKDVRPILVENAPAVRSTEICENRHIGRQQAPTDGFNAFADAVEIVSLQTDCREGRDLRFEVNRQKKKKKKH
jgi:polygalacturonase